MLHPEGRAILKNYGINVEFAEEEKGKDADKPIVVVLCPTYRAPEPQMKDALGKMVEYTRQKDFATIYSGAPVSASIVHWSRNWLISEQLKSGKPWTHALFIDDDIVVEPDTLERLLSHKKDIVGGLCTTRKDPPVPNIRYFDQGNARQIWEWPENKLIEVDAVGTGLMLISKHAIEQTAQAYFDCLYEQEHYGLCGEKLEHHKKVRLDKFDAEKMAYWFKFRETDNGDIEMGEDVYFCYMAKKYCGIPVYADTSIQPGHLGIYAYSIKDFRPYRDDCILRAKIKGDYPMEVPPMKISILCPTRKRPQNVVRLVDSIEKTSTVLPEIIFYVDEDDDTFPGIFKEVKTVRGPRILMSKMWDKCLEAATGEIVMMGGDDLIFQTKGWDDQVRRAFASFPDRIVFVHGDDGHWGKDFGTHGFLHRNWIEKVGYLCPPHYVSDYNDTHINEVANMIDRRVYLPFITEHMHPVWGKSEWDQTHKERLARQAQQKTEELYRANAWERERDAEILRKAIADYGKSMPARQPELAAVQSA